MPKSATPTPLQAGHRGHGRAKETEVLCVFLLRVGRNRDTAGKVPQLRPGPGDCTGDFLTGGVKSARVYRLEAGVRGLQKPRRGCLHCAKWIEPRVLLIGPDR